MSTLAPINDGQLIRSFNERIRDLEHRSTLRLGDWVIKAATDGRLTAVRPGIDPVVLSQVADYTKVIQEAVVAAITKGGYVSAVDLASTLMGLSAVTGTTPDTILAEITRWAEGLATGWNDALRLVGAATPSALLQLLAGLFPAAKTAIDGSLHALNIDGFVQNAEGTWSYIAQQGENGLSRLIQQADGTIINASHAVYQMATGAALAGAPLGQAVASGQQLVDHGIAAIEGEAIALGQSAQAHAAAMTAMFTNWVNAWSGQLLPSAASPEITAAALQAAQQAAAQAALTASINGQLPHFYGGHGTAGTNVAETINGGVLPATFTAVNSPVAVKVALHNTPALTDSQEVGCIWSTGDYLPKYMILRSSADGQNLVYAKLVNSPLNTGSEIGCYVGGVKTVLLSFNGGPSGNQPWTFSATDYTFTINGPGGFTETVIDSLHVSQKGALYVYGGFGLDGTVRSSANLGGGASSSSGTYTPAAGIVAGDKLDFGVFGGHGGSYTGQFLGMTLTWGTDIALGTNIGGSFVAAGNTVLTIPGVGTFTLDAVSGIGFSHAWNGQQYQQVFGVNRPGWAQFYVWDQTLPGTLINFNFYDSGPGVGPAVASVATIESTGSATYVNLPTVTDEVTVTVGPSGIVLVFIYAGLWNSSGNLGAELSFALSGANTQAAADNYSILNQSYAASGAPNIRLGAPFMIPNLLVGATTFKLKAKAVNGGTAVFQDRTIVAIPL